MSTIKDTRERRLVELDRELEQEVEEHFFLDPKKFRSLVCVIDVLSEGVGVDGGINTSAITLESLESRNRYLNFMRQLHVVNDVMVSLIESQYVDLNAGVETMGDMLKQYNSSRETVREIRESLTEVKSLLTKGMTQQRIRDLWFNKIQCKHTIRILDQLEMLRDACSTIAGMLDNKRYVSAATHLNDALAASFSMDLVTVKACWMIREELVLRKHIVLEEIVREMRGYVYIRTRPNEAEEMENAETQSQQSDSKSSDRGSYRGDLMETQSIGSFASSGSSNATDDRKYVVETYPTDLSEATIEAERQLTIPSAAGNLFIRLCVRALILLNYVDDAERMCAENSAEEVAAIMTATRQNFVVPQVTRGLGKTSERLEGNGRGKIFEEEQKRFSSYLKELLSGYCSMLQHLVYLVKLFIIARERGAVNAAMVGNIKDVLGSRQAVREVWSNVETVLLAELKRHFEIPETSSQDTSTRVFIPSSHAPNITSANLEGRDDKAAKETAVEYVCTPSPYLAVYVYRHVEKFVDTCDALFGGGMLKAPLGVVANRNSPESQLLKYVQSCVANVVMPLVQMDANQSMRRVTAQDDDSFVSAGVRLSDKGGGRKKAVPNRGADICLETVKPLFRYWLLVPQHSDQVVLILQRSVDAFMSASRELKEQLSTGLLAHDVCWKGHTYSHTTVREHMLQDKEFRRYRKKLFDGKLSPAEMLGVSSYVRQTASEMLERKHTESDEEESEHRMQSSMTSSSQRLRTGLAGDRPYLPLSVYALDYSPYVVSREKLLYDSKKISVLALMIYSCDWLAQQLCKASINAHKKLGAAHNRPAGRSQGGLGVRGSGMWLTITQCTGQLTGLAEEAAALLRTELELSCFYFLQQLPQKPFDSHSTNMKVMEPEPCVQALNQHLLTLQDAIVSVSTPELFAALGGTLLTLVPRLMQFSITHIHTYISADGMGRLSRTAVSVQQTLTSAVENSGLDRKTRTAFSELVTVEVAKLRKFVSILELQPQELVLYMRGHKDEFAKEEYNAAWRLACRRPITPTEDAGHIYTDTEFDLVYQT